LHRTLEGRPDANIIFSDLRGPLLHLGFEERMKGSHPVFRRADVQVRISVQR